METSLPNAPNETRREFLRTSLAASVFMMVGGVLELVGEVLPDDVKERGSQTHGLYTLRFANFPSLRTTGGSIRLQIPGAPLSLGQIIITRFEANRFSALSEECTHEGNAVSNFANGRFTCPRHNSQFAGDGRVLRGPATAPLRSFPVTFNTGDDFVVIDVPGLTATAVKGESQFSSALNQNYPNPASTNTIIEYSLAKDAFVTIGIYSVLGKEIIELVRKDQEAGQHRVSADVSNLSKGVYFYRMDTSIGFSQTRKLTVI
ncbi:MAG: T9SS C-terminal target domain-containing protein [Candidatus Kapaibacterium sp.]|nr:MAG: T9SS C-terminal target domain-containing protein [Candidatus Kapabacteria bacterium]